MQIDLLLRAHPERITPNKVLTGFSFRRHHLNNPLFRDREMHWRERKKAGPTPGAGQQDQILIFERGGSVRVENDNLIAETLPTQLNFESLWAERSQTRSEDLWTDLV